MAKKLTPSEAFQKWADLRDKIEDKVFKPRKPRAKWPAISKLLTRAEAALEAYGDVAETDFDWKLYEEQHGYLDTMREDAYRVYHD